MEWCQQGSGEVVKQVFLSASVHHMVCVCGWVSFTMSNNCSSFMVIADCIIMIYSFITATLSIMQILSVQPQTKSSPLGPEEACGWIWSSFYNVNVQRYDETKVPWLNNFFHPYAFVEYICYKIVRWGWSSQNIFPVKKECVKKWKPIINNHLWVH